MKIITEIIEIIKQINNNTTLTISHKIEETYISVVIDDCYGLLSSQQLNFESPKWAKESKKLLKYLQNLFNEEQERMSYEL